MARYEYKVVPAPKKPGKIKGVKGTDNRFAAELAALMNQYGAEGWEYQRTDTLPCEERQGLTGRVTVFQNMLIFRRTISEAIENKSENIAPTVRSAPVEGKAPPLVAAVPAPAPKPESAPDIAAQ